MKLNCKMKSWHNLLLIIHIAKLKKDNDVITAPSHNVLAGKGSILTSVQRKAIIFVRYIQNLLEI